MLKKKLLGMVILLVGVMLVFAVISCNDDDESKDKPKDDGSKSGSDSGIGAITSLSVKTKGIKSLYAGNLAVTGNSIGRAIVGGNGDILTLSHIDENGNNSPVVFTGSSGKQYMLEIIGMEKIDDKRIIVGYNGIYEVTTGDDGKIVVGAKETRTLSGALIDMSSGKVYEFNYVWTNKIEGMDVFCHPIFFIEKNIAYFQSDYPNATVYKFDLTAASPQKVPLSNGKYNPINIARPAFTIDEKLITVSYFGEQEEWYSMDTAATRPPTPVTWATLPASAISSTDGVNYTVTLTNRGFWEGLMMKDLSGNTWMYSHYWVGDEGGQENYHIDIGAPRYLIVKLNMDNNGNFRASNQSTGNINFTRVDDQYPFNPGGGKLPYLPFYINDAGIGLSSFEDPYSSGVAQTKTFLHNGMYLLNTEGFIKITKKQNGIEQTSTALKIPKVTRRNAVISKDDYLYWVETGAIKRLKLESGASVENVYTNSQIISSTSRDCLTASGSDTLIFYQYIDASKVNTYALDLNNPIYAPIRKLAENDIEIKTIAELKF